MRTMSTARSDIARPGLGLAVEQPTEIRQQEALLETGALQTAIYNSANF